MSTIAKMALMINLFLVFSINDIYAGLITLVVTHMDPEASGAIVHVWPPHSDYYTVDIGEDTEREFELTETGLYAFAAQSYDQHGNESEQTEMVFYEVKPEDGEGDGNSQDDGGEDGNETDLNNISNGSGSCFLLTAM